MTTPHGASPDDSLWRRPTEPPLDAPSAPPAAAPDGPARPAYPGPPASVAPPGDWRPPVHLQPPPPRQLPGQDLARLTESEDSARTLTYGVGLIVGAVLLVLTCLLCSRVLF